MLLLVAPPPQLFPDGTLLIHVALILLMIWLLNRTLFRPINRILQAREDHKGGHAGEAAGILRSVEEKNAKYNGELLDARGQGYDLVEKEQKKAVAAREKKLADVKSEIAGTLESGRAEIAQQTAAARDQIGTDAGQIAEQIAANILRK